VGREEKFRVKRLVEDIVTHYTIGNSGTISKGENALFKYCVERLTMIHVEEYSEDPSVKYSEDTSNEFHRCGMDSFFFFFAANTEYYYTLCVV
jgi:hypothetical protein